MENKFLKAECKAKSKNIILTYLSIIGCLFLIYLLNNFIIFINFRDLFLFLNVYSSLVIIPILYIAIIYNFWLFFGDVFDTSIKEGITRKEYIKNALKLIFTTSITVVLINFLISFFSGNGFNVAENILEVLKIILGFLTIAQGVNLIKKYKYGLIVILGIIIILIAMNLESFMWHMNIAGSMLFSIFGSEAASIGFIGVGNMQFIELVPYVVGIIFLTIWLIFSLLKRDVIS